MTGWRSDFAPPCGAAGFGSMPASDIDGTRTHAGRGRLKQCACRPPLQFVAHVSFRSRSLKIHRRTVCFNFPISRVRDRKLKFSCQLPINRKSVHRLSTRTMALCLHRAPLIATRRPRRLDHDCSCLISHRTIQFEHDSNASIVRASSAACAEQGAAIQLVDQPRAQSRWARPRASTTTEKREIV